MSRTRSTRTTKNYSTRPVYEQKVENVVSFHETVYESYDDNTVYNDPSTRMRSKRKQSKNRTLYEYVVLPVYESKVRKRRPIHENAV